MKQPQLSSEKLNMCMRDCSIYIPKFDCLANTLFIRGIYDLEWQLGVRAVVENQPFPFSLN